MTARPWEKSLSELSKYDWLTAVCHSKRHAQRSLDLRVAFALMQHADADTMLAWPTQQSLTDLCGVANPRQVRRAIASLKSSGAIEVKKLSEVSEETASASATKRKNRGRAYRLKLFWAFETMEAHRSPVSRQREPQKLAVGKEQKRTTAVLQKRTTAVRCEQDYSSPTNTTSQTKETKEGFERKTLKVSASGREANAYAAAKERAA